MGLTEFRTFSVAINIYRNGDLVAQVNCPNGVNGGAMAWTQDGYSNAGEEWYTPELLGDESFGSLALDDHFGFWAADGDRIQYEVDVTYEHLAGLNGYPNFVPGNAQFTANGLFNWRFALEDSHVD